MPYVFSELGELSCPEVARLHRADLLGRIAVCSSFDSGRRIQQGWRQVNGYDVSPTIDDELIDAWRVSHDEYCDEWWIFDREVPTDFAVHAFCNFMGVRLSEIDRLDFDGGCRMRQYLSQYRPAMVFGNNDHAYLIRRTDG